MGCAVSSPEEATETRDSVSDVGRVTGIRINDEQGSGVYRLTKDDLRASNRFTRLQPATSLFESGSESDRLREQGNAAYRSANDGLAPAAQLKSLQKAADLYERALTKATNDTERSSVYKNLAMANWKMAKTNLSALGGSAVITRCFKDALTHFQSAKEFGKGRDSVWLSNLEAAGTSCWSDVREALEDQEYGTRMKKLERLMGYIISDATKAREYLELADYYFHCSITALGGRNYQQSLNLLAECNFPLNEARRLLKAEDDPIHARECETLEKEIFIQTCVTESIQANRNGEELLQRVIQNGEDLNLDMVWEVVDMFHRAAMLTRELDLELEAIALTSLGQVYDKVLKMKDRAKTCLRRVLELADAMAPQPVWNLDWYVFARDTLQRYQQETAMAEALEEMKQRDETRKLIQTDLATLNYEFMTRSKLEFLKFIYATYPPKDPRHKLGDVSDTPEPDELKKLYRTAALHYHPDMVDVEQHGKKWQLLTEEIEKLINQHYGYFKGVD